MACTSAMRPVVVRCSRSRARAVSHRTLCAGTMAMRRYSCPAPACALTRQARRPTENPAKACPGDHGTGSRSQISDRGDVDGSAEDVVALVVSGGHGTMAFEFVDGPLDDVALPVPVRIESRWSPARATTAQPVVGMVDRLRDGRHDAASPQVRPDRAAGVGLVGQHVPGSGAGPARSAAANPDAGHHRLEGQRVVAMSGRGRPRDRPATAIAATWIFEVSPCPASHQPRVMSRLRAKPAQWSHSGALGASAPRTGNSMTAAAPQSTRCGSCVGAHGVRMLSVAGSARRAAALSKWPGPGDRPRDTALYLESTQAMAASSALPTRRGHGAACAVQNSPRAADLRGSAASGDHARLPEAADHRWSEACAAFWNPAGQDRRPRGLIDS